MFDYNGKCKGKLKVQLLRHWTGVKNMIKISRNSTNTVKNALWTDKFDTALLLHQQTSDRAVIGLRISMKVHPKMTTGKRNKFYQILIPHAVHVQKWKKKKTAGNVMEQRLDKKFAMQMKN